MKSAIIAASLASASAFTGVPLAARSVARNSGSALRMAEEMSPSLPFLTYPKNLKGVPGSVGFDPLGLADINDLGLDAYWMREAEIKHCRLAMMAVSGFIFCDTIGSFPGMPQGKDQVDLFFQVWAEKPSTIGALVFAVSLIEAISWLAIVQGRADGSREPGDFKLDPISGGNAAKKADMQLKEIKNGRLAMFAAMGLMAQGATTHTGCLDNLGAIWS